VSRRYWLMKTEPSAFSLDDLKAKGVEPWDGVRNYQARNLMRDEMRVGDGVLFYHSSTDPPGVVGLAEIAREGYPDPTAFDPKAAHYDPKSRPEAPTWYLVDVRFVRAFPRIVTLAELKATPGLEHMKVVQRASRLSVQPVTPDEWRIVVALAEG